MQPTERFKNTLTEKQLKLAEAYITNGRDIGKAAMKVGYGGRNAKAAYSAGWGLLRGKTRTAKIVQAYINRRTKNVSRKMQVGFEEKRKKLWHIAEECAPETGKNKTATTLKHGKTAVSALTEMNKMDGDIAAEKRVEFNVSSDEDVQCMKEAMKEVDKINAEHRKEY